MLYVLDADLLCSYEHNYRIMQLGVTMVTFPAIRLGLFRIVNTHSSRAK